MMLTTRGRYAVMAMAYMASVNCDNPITISTISKEQNIPMNYLEQIFVKLRKHGLLKSVKGPGGGYVFAKDLYEITVADIIHAVDERIKITRCDGVKSQGCMPDHVRCLTHNLWDELGKNIENYLHSINLEDFSSGKFKYA